MREHTSIESSHAPAIQVRVGDNLWSAIESFRRNEPDIPTRPEAVRRLLERALAAPPQSREAA